MTDAEHYIENAINLLEKGVPYKDFFNNIVLKEGEELTGIPLSYIWEMAQYIVYSYKTYIEQEFRNNYGAIDYKTIEKLVE